MTASPPRSARKPLNLAPPPDDTAERTLAVVRLPEPSRRFAWEIRRLSAIVVARSPGDFATADLARADGQTALDALLTMN